MAVAPRRDPARDDGDRLGRTAPPAGSGAAVRELPGSPAAAQRLRPLANFSTWITPVAALLTASGLTLACLQLDQLSDLWQTRYGQVLIVKLALVAALLCVAAVNRWRLTQPTLLPANTRPRSG
ncbi:hypothetical protein CDEF62S_05728 [Castellaniella defragrans]